MVNLPGKAWWRSALEESGAVFATTSGMSLMQLWSVDSWGSLDRVRKDLYLFIPLRYFWYCPLVHFFLISASLFVLALTAPVLIMCSHGS